MAKFLDGFKNRDDLNDTDELEDLDDIGELGEFDIIEEPEDVEELDNLEDILVDGDSAETEESESYFYQDDEQKSQYEETSRYDSPKFADSKNRKKLPSKKKKKLRVLLLGIISALLVGILICAAAIINRYLPTSEKMSGYSYYNVSETDDVLIVIDKKVQDTKGIFIEGRLYIPQDFTSEYLNQRFYSDSESQSILFTSGDDIYTFPMNSKTYTDKNGASHQMEYAVAVQNGGKTYIDFGYLSGCTNIMSNYFDAPKRIVISSDFSEKNYVKITKSANIRYRGGIKSPILEKLQKDTVVEYSRTVGEWAEVRTESGFLGYVPSDSVSNVFTEKKQNVYEDNFSAITRNKKISLVWFQVTNTTANSGINDYLQGTQGITTISPTWYSISSNNGEMTCLATKAAVDGMHSKGYEVWPLIDDFSSSLNGVQLYSSKSARTKMINTLIGDAKKYGYDGLNLDCEKVTKESAKHFLQFVRELSVACRKNGIILSSDNYKSSASSNSFYDLAEQASFVDYIIIMGYDEHYAGSDSGSVASIGFVKEGITGALNFVPAAKLINAVPFYTRIWSIAKSGGETTSKAVGMQTAIDDLKSHGAPAIWDETAGQYFGSYETSTAVVKIWLEEKTSIEAKMKLIKENNLAGVAAWKLGLENKDVWSVISNYNQ